MLTFEGIINKLMEGVHKLWECQSEQLKVEKFSSQGYLLLLQLNPLPVYYVSENFVPFILYKLSSSNLKVLDITIGIIKNHLGRNLFK